jgi:hypothetical protein
MEQKDIDKLRGVLEQGYLELNVETDMLDITMDEILTECSEEQQVDFLAFIDWCELQGHRAHYIASNIMHDVNRIVVKIPNFEPKTKGYAERTK